MNAPIDSAARGQYAPALLQPPQDPLAQPQPQPQPQHEDAGPGSAAPSPLRHDLLPADAAPPEPAGVGRSPFAGSPAPRGSRRERAIAVETEGLGLVKVRRVSLGGIARCADRLREAGPVAVASDDALVDALIEEVLTVGDGPRRRADTEQLGRLSDDDRRSIAAAVLTLEGVKAAGDGVLQDPLVSLVTRYGPVVGVGERARRVPASLALMPETTVGREPARPTPGEPTRAAAGDLPPDRAAAHDFSLPEDIQAARLATTPEPQIPLFDSGELPPPLPEPRLPPDGVAAPAATRAARVQADQSRDRLHQLIDAQHHALIDVSDGQRALAAEVEALTARLAQSDAAARRLRLFAGASAGAAAIALMLMVAQTVVSARTERQLADEQRQLRAELQQQADTLKETQAALARAERTLAARSAPRPAAAAPAAPRARAPRTR